MTVKRSGGSLKSRLMAGRRPANHAADEIAAEGAEAPIGATKTPLSPADLSRKDDWHEDVVELPAIMMTTARRLPSALPEKASQLPHWRDNVPNLIEPEIDVPEADLSSPDSEMPPSTSQKEAAAGSHAADLAHPFEPSEIAADEADPRPTPRAEEQVISPSHQQQADEPQGDQQPEDGWQDEEEIAADAIQTAKLTPIVPRATMAGRALVLVIAIMGFLACLTVGGLSVLVEATRDWQSDIARQMTIQIDPTPGLDMAATLSQTAKLASSWPGVGRAVVLSDRETKALLQPWLGASLDLDELPVPRLIQVELSDRALFDPEKARQELAERVARGTLDDHQRWTDRLSTMASAAVWVGIFVLLLVLTAMVLSVTFATRAAMAANRNVIELLHLVGADNSFIAGQFQIHFLALGLKGGIAGGSAAIISLFLAAFLTSTAQGSALADQVSALTGGFQIGFSAILGAAVVVGLVAIITALTSRLTVQHFVRDMN